jgi:hypothetical protein
MMAVMLTACGGPSRPHDAVAVKITAVAGDTASTLANHCQSRGTAPYNAYQSTYLKQTGQLTNSGKDSWIHIGQEYTILIGFWPAFIEHRCPLA